MDIVINVIIPLLLAVIMFSLGLGLTVEDFRRVARRPSALAAGLLAQVVLLPIVAYLLVAAFGLSGALAVGFMILSFCPGGVTSNVMSRLARSDVALSVSLTGVVSLLSVLTVPFLIAWAVGHFEGAAGPAVDIISLGVSVFLIVAVPVGLGLLLRHRNAALADRLEPPFSKAAIIIFALFVVLALAANWQLFVDNLVGLGVPLILLNVAMLAIGLALGALFALGPREGQTIAIEAGVQNGTMGITLAGIVAGMGAETLGPYALASAVYGITMYAVTLPAVWFFRRQKRYELPEVAA